VTDFYCRREDTTALYRGQFTKKCLTDSNSYRIWFMTFE